MAATSVLRPGEPSAEPEAAAVPSSYHLSAALARGDAQAFDAFYQLWFDRLFGMVRAFTGRDESFCLDVVQDCMMRVASSLPVLSNERAVAAWMARTLFRIAVDHVRKEQRRRRRERDVARQAGAPTHGEPTGLLQAEEQQAWLRARLAELPEPDRRLLAERFGAGKTLAAVGAFSGITGHAAHGRISRIVRLLREAATRIFGDSEVTDD